MLKQEEAFLKGEADAWFNRNFHKMEKPDDEIAQLVVKLWSRGDILEYGCANGWRLEQIRLKTGAECYGCDPSRAAIEAGAIRFPSLHFRVGTAREPYGECGIIIYGFCLYLCEPNHLSQIVSTGDYALMDGGYLIIHDFDPDHPHCVPYKHLDDAYSYKMDYSKLWLANPAYSLVKKIKPDKDTAIWVLKKDLSAGWPVEDLK